MTRVESASRRRAALAGLAALLCAALAGLAAAQAPAGGPRVAVLSLIGDRLLIVERQMRTGSHVDRNTRDFVDLPTDVLDLRAAKDFEDMLRQAKPGVQAAAIRSRDPALKALQQEVVEGSRPARDIAERLRPALQAQGFTHLALLTRQRGAAKIRVADGSIGVGRLEGLGFYVDRWALLQREDTGQVGSGYVAPFAYYRATVVDLASGAVLAEAYTGEAAAFSTNRSDTATNAWDAMTAEEKTASLGQFVRLGLQGIVPALAGKIPATR